MIYIDLGKYRQARVWIGELPDTKLDESGYIEREFKVYGSSHKDLRQAAVEIVIPAGAIARYGLLGATFVPGGHETLLTRVSVTGDTGRSLGSSLAVAPDIALVALPRFYTDHVLAGVEDAASGQLLGPGLLKFHHAAYGKVGSSASVFHRLAACVATILGSYSRFTLIDMRSVIADAFGI